MISFSNLSADKIRPFYKILSIKWKSSFMNFKRQILKIWKLRKCSYILTSKSFHLNFLYFLYWRQTGQWKIKESALEEREDADLKWRKKKYWKCSSTSVTIDIIFWWPQPFSTNHCNSLLLYWQSKKVLFII